MTITLRQAKEKYIKAKEAYYNGSPIMSDPAFDRLEDAIRKKDPNWEELSKTGVKVRGNKAKLPYYMPSLRKCYPEQVESWFDTYSNVREWAYMAKLDGCSVLLQYKNGKPYKLFTRGNGTIGRDISSFLPYLSIPKTIKDKSLLSFRCEAIVRRTDFNLKWSSEFDASRNMVSGLLNRNDKHKALKDIHFVVLGIFTKTLREGLKYAFELGFETVFARYAAPRMHALYFDDIKKGKYDADGVVICNPEWVYKYDSSDKPKTDIVAYKENVEFKESEVVDVIYQISSAGRIIPKIQIKPTVLNGATIEFCTCHNAKWMVQKKIGVGAIVRLTRAGDVIPKIIDVVKPGEIQYPPYQYKEEGVHWLATERSGEQVVRIFTRFVETLGIETVKGNTLKVFYKAGITSLHKFIKMLHNPQLHPQLVKKFGMKRGENIYRALMQIVDTRWPIAKLMVASCVFHSGVGEKRLNALQELDFDLMKLSQQPVPVIKYSIISPGIGETTAELIALGLHDFYHQFWKANSKYLRPPLKYKKRKVITNGKLSGVKVTFTGYRDKDQEQVVIDNGGEIISFSSKTTVLLYKAGGKSSSKIAKAGDKAMTFDQFKRKYSL